VHPLAWGTQDYHLYRLTLDLTAAPTMPIGLKLRPPGELIQGLRIREDI
jgi:hypothetical protein